MAKTSVCTKFQVLQFLFGQGENQTNEKFDKSTQQYLGRLGHVDFNNIMVINLPFCKVFLQESLFIKKGLLMHISGTYMIKNL